MKPFLVFILLIPNCLFGQVSEPAEDEMDDWVYSLPFTKHSVDTLQRAISPYKRSNLDLLKKYADYSLQMSNEINFPLGQSRALNLLGVYYMAQDLYNQAMEQYIKSIQILDSLGDDQSVATVAANIGIIYDELGQAENAKKYFLKSRKVFSDLKKEKYVSILDMNLGASYFNLEDYDSALYYFKSIIPYRESIDDSHGLATAYSNIGETQAVLTNYHQSIQNYKKARLYIDKGHLLVVDIYLGIARSYLRVEQIELALSYLDSGLNAAIEGKQKRLEAIAYVRYKEYYESLGNYKMAYEYFTKEDDLDEEIRGEEVQGQIEVLNLKYEDEKKARQLATLEAKRAKDEFYFYISLASGIFIFCISLLLIITLRLKLKNGKLKQLELKNQLEQKTKEVTSYALNFIQKNELMQELTQKINELKPRTDSGGIKDLNQMNKIIDSSFRIDQDWENFKIMFEEVHSGFITRIKDTYPTLGNSELKLCALLRLNMNLKEASSVLGISPDSVKTARYRLRKKLNLETEDNLVDFLIMFDAQHQTLAQA